MAWQNTRGASELNSGPKTLNMDCCPPPKRPQVLNRPVLHPSWASFRIVLPIVMLMECAPCATFPISTGAVVVPDLRFCGPWSKVAELDTPPSHPRRGWVQYWTESCPRAWHTSHLEAQTDRPVVSLKPLGCTRAGGGGGQHHLIPCLYTSAVHGDSWGAELMHSP